MKTLFTLFISFLSVTISALSQEVQLEWAKQIGLNNYANAKSVAVDKSGNVYSTGRFAGLVDFDPNEGKYEIDATHGQVNWGDMYISKLNSRGEFVWVKSFGDSLFQEGCAVATDNLNNVYAVGYYEGTVDLDPGIGTLTEFADFPGSDAFIVKLDSSGNFIWGKVLPHFVRYISFASNSFKCSIKFDSYGNVYINTYKGIIKYDQNGNLIWNMEATPVLSNWDYEQCTGTCIDIDVSNTIYSAGNYTGKVVFDGDTGNITITGSPTMVKYFESGTDIFIAKSNASGKYAWAKGATHTPNATIPQAYSNTAKSIAVDSWGNVYVTGSFDGSLYVDSKKVFDPFWGYASTNTFLFKFDTHGALVWAKNIETGNYTGGNSIAVDNAGDIYLYGDFNKTADFDPGPENYFLTMDDSIYYRHSFVAKFDSSGNFKWVKQFSMKSSDHSFSGSIVVDGSRNIYITGFFNGSADFDPGPGEYILTAPNNTSNAYIVMLSQHPVEVKNEETAISHLSAYPNPASGALSINFGKHITNGRIKLINLFGQTMLEQSNINGTSLTLDIADQPGGMYVIEVNEGGIAQRVKVVKE